MIRWLEPQSALSDSDVRRGMRLLLAEGIFVQTMFALTTGAFLVGFALMLGASHKVIGILAAIGPLSQVLQVPTVYLVERTRRRKLLLVGAAVLSRMVWLFIAALPWLVPRAYALPIFVAALGVHWGVGAVGGCAFNSWLRDFIPQERSASFFARRFALMIAISAVLSLAGGYGIDLWKAHFEQEAGAYGILFVCAAACGLGSVVLLARTPEPQMPSVQPMGLAETLREPLRDVNYRKLLVFLGWWSFAVNLAAPFFAVYLLERLKLSMSWVLGLTVLSQMVNVLFFRVWGSLADRFSNKSVLAASGSLFIFSFLLWPFTTLPETYIMTIPLLVAIHVLAGVSTAGVTLSAWNLALKSAPYGKGASYLAVNALVSGVAASVSPVLAGVLADWFASEELTLTLRLASSAGRHGELLVPTVDLRGLDFLFLIAFGLGLYSLHRLLAVREEGEVREAVVRQALLMEMVRSLRQISTVAGVREVLVFPYALFRRLRQQRNGTADGATQEPSCG